MTQQNKYDLPKVDENLLEKEFQQLDSIEFQDLKINPDYYLHTAIVKAQDCLNNPDLKDAFLRYRMFAEHIEMICRASNRLPEKYPENVRAYSEEIKTENLTEDVRGVRIATKKMELLLGQVFNSKAKGAVIKI